jgi:hypothetical protein
MLTKEKKRKLMIVAKDAALAFNTKPTEKNYNEMQSALAALNVGLEKIGLKEKDRIEICRKRQKLQKELSVDVDKCKETKKPKKGTLQVTQVAKKETVGILQEAS